jgi:small subunit ribosomal protein S5
MTDTIKDIKQEKKKQETDALAKLSDRERGLMDWIPKTELGKKVKNGEITNINDIFDKNKPILEPGIVDTLTELEENVIDVKKTTRVVRAGRKFSFRVAVLVGNRNGLIGLGVGKDRDKWPAVRKATRNAKMNLVRVVTGSGSWEEQLQADAKHSIPFKVTGKCGSVKVTFLPAPRGTGLVIGQNIKPVLQFAGITDIWSQTKGATDTKLNFIRAAIDALTQTAKVKASNTIARKVLEKR